MDLWSGYVDVEDPPYLERQQARLLTAGRVLNRLRRYAPEGRLLDVGCATGDFLTVARTLYDVEGLELSTWAADCAERRGLTIHRCRLDALRTAAPYQLITLWGVIEHFEDPDREVRRMRELLEEGGLVCLWTGDVRSWPARILGRHWWYVIGQHIQLFSRQSLRKLFLDRGFEEVWIGCYPYVTTCGSIAKSLDRYRSVLLKRLLRTPLAAQRSIALSIPGEMFAIFRKVTGEKVSHGTQ
ncbi:MAG: hypothetical protein A3D28_01990 [Omnitrophica bacterium RIFCSPHIGHO2_02_FULL_63_14]|nr:MAG: hypothetical protein A3D28_01990 [Omnitrophica bacterium RIFCSPHIGHO2_02_FULL_63_14]